MSLSQNSQQESDYLFIYEKASFLLAIYTTLGWNIHLHTNNYGTLVDSLSHHHTTHVQTVTVNVQLKINIKLQLLVK